MLDATGLEQVSNTLAPLSEWSVDVEADAMHAFRARLCFVQIGTDADVWLLDTLVPEVKIAALAEQFADPNRTKFFHAAGGDLQYLAAAGVRVKGLFDTHRAVTLLGWPKVGLADLVLEKLQIKLLKEHQQSDFSLRPLPPGMREYIADDVRYLTEIGRQVRQACVDADILEEVVLDCARMADEAAQRPDFGHDYKPKIPRGGLSATQIRLAEAIAFELHQLRLELADSANVPMGRMLSNAAVGAIAAKPPVDLKELGRREGVRGAFAREYGDRVLALVQSLQDKATRDELPVVDEKPKRDPKAKKREDQLKVWRAEKAVGRKVTPSAVLSNALAQDLADAPPESVEALALVPYFGEKRVKMYGPELITLLHA